MKKIILLFTLLLFLMGCASTQRLDELDRDMKAATLSGGKVSSYTTLTQGNLADGDTFVARDISDTPPATGTIKQYAYLSIKDDIQESIIPRACFTLQDPVDGDHDNIPIFSYEVAFTVTKMRCWTEGGTSAIIVLEDDSANSLDSMTCDADGTDDDSSIANATFAADEQMSFDTGTVIGAVEWVNFCFSYNIDSP